MELCLLEQLASRLPEKENTYDAVLPASAILEPTALEKLWLYLFMRPHVKSVRPLAFDEHSLRDAALYGDPMRINASLPEQSSHSRESLSPLPLVFHATAYASMLKERPQITEESHRRDHYQPIVRLVKQGRVYREPLYTIVHQQVDTQLPQKYKPLLNIGRAHFSRDDLPQHMWSEHAYYKWSARQEEHEMYDNSLESVAQKNAFDFWAMPYRAVRYKSDKPRVMFIMPWMQMGGSEKCMLDVADRFVKMDWPITFVFTMPFWHEDDLGEMSLKHEWISKAFAITSDVFDLVGVSPNHKFSKALRYIVESRAPQYVLTGNSRVVYEHAKFIKALSPSTIIADYNHMVHMDWEVVPEKGGGMPRYGTTYTQHFDLHLTASDNVSTSMKSWIDPDIVREQPHKVKTCYIGTEPSQLHGDDAKALVRSQMRHDLDIPQDAIVVLFAGRFVQDKGIDVMGEVVSSVADDADMAKRLAFVFVGSGEQKDMLESTRMQLQGKDPLMIMQPPAVGIAQLRDYYAMSDIFLLPSNNEGIALVLYEAMAAGLLVMSTDVGGQKELIRTNTGVLLPNLSNPSALASFIVQQLKAVTKFSPMFKDIQQTGTQEVREKFTTERFCDCVVNNMIRAKKELDKRPKLERDDKVIEDMRGDIAEVMRQEKVHGAWNRDQVDRSIESQVTVGIKTYVCDSSIVRQVLGLVRSIRVNYPKVRVLLANDGPTSLSDAPLIKKDPYTEEVRLAPDSGISVGRNHMVNMTTTRYFLLLDDDHVFDEDTDLGIAVNGIGKEGFDIVGVRVRNLPGIEELERIFINIPRYVAKVSKFENREVTLCVWNENNGPGVQKMRVPIRVDVLHNALLAKTDVLRAHPWRNILKVNEHMTFFLDAKKAGVKVGYLPSVFVHHRARRYSACYKAVRFREQSYEKLLEYKDSYLWDVPCGDNFPETVREHLRATGAEIAE
ncbi:Transferase [Gracilaria domingensis]|nr:Transferase [Gracilaria domingensis]